MRINAIYNVVWNRKGQVLDPGDKALVQVEIILVDRKKKYIGTGIYLESGQFDKKTRQISADDVSGRLNKRIGDFIGDLRRWELSIIDSGRYMRSEDVDAFLEQKPGDGSFYSFMEDRVKKRPDIVEGTRRLHRVVLKILKDRGIINFSDLTFENIQAMDDHLRSNGLAQPTIAKRHQVIKTYIGLASDRGLFDLGDSPYLKFKFKRGINKIRARLDEDEIIRLINKKFVDPALELTRDIFAFQIFSGCAYKDLQALTWSGHIRKNKGEMWIEGLRKKSGEYYSVFLDPEAIALIKKYKGQKGDFLFPAPPQYRQNRDLKVLAAACEINKLLSTHIGRHTAATKWIRDGVDIYVVRDMLGQTKVTTTEIYAKLEKERIRSEMLNSRRRRGL